MVQNSLGCNALRSSKKVRRVDTGGLYKFDRSIFICTDSFIIQMWIMPRRSKRQTAKRNYVTFNCRGDSSSSSSSSSSSGSPSKKSSSGSTSSSADSEATVPYVVDQGQGLPAIAEDPAANVISDQAGKNGKESEVEKSESNTGKGFALEQLGVVGGLELVDNPKGKSKQDQFGGARPKVREAVDFRGDKGSDSEEEMQKELDRMKERELRLREKIKKDKLRKEIARKKEEVDSLQAVIDSQSPEFVPEVADVATPGKKKKGKKVRTRPGGEEKPNLKIEISNPRAKDSVSVPILFDSDAEIAQLEDEFQGASAARVRPKAKSAGVTIKELRKIPKIAQRADDALANMGLLQDESSDDESAMQQGQGKGKLLKSGMEVKASQRVVQQLLWPHVTLQYEFVSRDLAFKDLDIRLLGAGELEIITRSDVSDSERAGRLEILKNLFYFSTQVDMATVRAMYAAVLRQIEVGSLSWDADPYQIMQIMLMKVWGSKNPTKGKSQEKRVGSTGIWWCRDFQKGSCTFSSSHSKNIRGKDTWVQHICATCWQKQKKVAYHSENGGSCPMKAKKDQDGWEEI